jgi:hypothetical protein
MKICGPRVDIQEVQGPFCKVVEIKEFPDLIYNGKFRGPSPRCSGPAARSGPRWTTGARHTGARAHRSSPAGRNRDRGDTGNSIGCSLGRGRQRGGRAMEGNGGGGRCASEEGRCCPGVLPVAFIGRGRELMRRATAAHGGSIDGRPFWP